MTRVEAYLKALELAFSKMDSTSYWPVPVADVAPYFSDLEALDLIDCLKAAEEQGLTKKDIASTIASPTVLRQAIPDILVGLKACTPPVSKETRMWLVEYLFDILEEMMVSDIFCQGGENLRLDQGQVQILLEQSIWIGAAEQYDFVKEVHRLSTTLLSLMWALYFYTWPNVGFEFHGPYRVALPGAPKRKAILIVRDFFNLHPWEIWPPLDTIPCSQVRILAIYDTALSPTIDIFGHMLHSGDLISSCLAVSIYVDSEIIQTVYKLSDLNTRLLAAISEQSQRINIMDRRGLIEKYILIRYYIFRGLRTLLHRDWKPPTVIYQRLDEWGLISSPEAQEFNWHHFEQTFDPRNDFVPGITRYEEK